MTNDIDYETKLKLMQELVEEERAAKLAWADRYNREVNGINNEGDPIGGDPPFGLKQRIDTLCAKVEELQRKLGGSAKHEPLYSLPPNLPAMIEQARAEERETCAKVCESEWVGDSLDDGRCSNSDMAYNEGRRECADAIRARGEKK